MKKVILVSGSAGMIGSNLCHWLIDYTNHDVIGIDDLSGGYESNMPDDLKFRFIKMDIGNDYLDNVFQIYKPNIVYHAAAYAAENLSPFIRKFNYTNNLVATSNVVNCCIEYDIERLVFFSSIAVYGHGNPPFIENQIPKPNDPYGIAKYACEMDIKVAGEQHGLDWCIVRPYNVYGKRQNIKDRYRNVLGIFMNQYFNKRPFTIFGDGSQVRSFTNVQDILLPLYNAGIKPYSSKKIINLGSNKLYSVKEAAETLIKILGSGEIKYLDARHEVHTAFADNSLAKSILDYKDNIALHDGLIEMYEWVLKNPIKSETIAPEFEIKKGMYKAWIK